jgi:predicted RNA-binding Zn-ribbon protein involved in translation (DUF1610 family)
MSGNTKKTETTMRKEIETNATTNKPEESKAEPNKPASNAKEIQIGAPDIEDEIQLERREAYVELETQKLLRELLKEGSKKEIIPIYDPPEGYSYKSIKQIFEGETTNKEIIDFLDRLTRLDILQKSFYDSVSTCPNCDSTNITLHNGCTKCKSHRISKTSLTEHIPCGYIGERDKYIQGKCPKCGLNINETPYVNLGRWYVCQECGEKFEHPQLDAVCRTCDTIFTVEETNLKEISKYILNEHRKKEVRQNVSSLESISKLLANLDFEIQMPGIAIGEKSGMRHQFSLIAKKDFGGRQKIIALDHVVAENEVQTSPLILYVYKTSEVTVDLPIFIAVPKLSETARKIVQGHQILLIEGSPDEEDNIAKVKIEIQNRLTERPPEPTVATRERPQQSAKPAQTSSETVKPPTKPTIKQEEEKKVQLFSTTSTIHPEKKTGGFMGVFKRKPKKDEED